MPGTAAAHLPHRCGFWINLQSKINKHDRCAVIYLRRKYYDDRLAVTVFL